MNASLTQATINPELAKLVFDTDEAPSMLQRLQTLYRKSIWGDLDAALFRLHNPMNRDQPAQVMIWVILKVQLFLLSHPEDNMSPPDTALINYAQLLRE